MSTASTKKRAHCELCGAILIEDAACTSCIRYLDSKSKDDAERLRRYAVLPKSVPNGGIIMPQ